ncbi:DUF4382 domain-containing protein [Variovorax humicola]|uniref:DUF4382 domain-containing protein n=1 Tax=Variovorax humicola TaxID=1769758 RepID=A0ABU8W9B5_9BURK
MKTFACIRAALSAVVLGSLLACGGGGGGGGGSVPVAATPTPTPTAEKGTLRLAMTDAPACGYDAVNVTVTKVRVHQAANAAESEAGWQDLPVDPPARIDLLSLTNGVLLELGQMPLPVGKYTQLRLVLTENSGSTPLANSVIPTGEKEIALKTPSGQQSGLKANANIDVAANQMADFVIDFDACKSVVKAGNSGQYLLKPVLSVVPRLVSGVLGYVDVGVVGPQTSVSLQQNGVIVKATVPDSAGKFVVQPVPAGSYHLVLTAPGHTTAVVTSVPVADQTVTTLNATTSALAVSTSPTATLSGAVSTASSPIEAQVRALQPLSGGPTIVVADRAVDGDTGAYTYAVPVNAPLVAPYVVSPAALVFAPNTAAAGKYVVEASGAGAVKTATSPTLAGGATFATNFTLP